jgi:hypothetical protein
VAFSDTNPSPFRDWYSISLETLRRWAIFGLVAAIGAVSFYAYRDWDRGNTEALAAELIDESARLLARLERHPAVATFRGEYDAGRAHLDAAREAQQRTDFPTAARRARQSHDLVAAVLGSIEGRGPGDAQFLTVSGSGVEYRRGGVGPWEEARSRVLLRSGDYVKTSHSGSAEIMFGDGTLYTMRPGTLIVVSGDSDPDGPAGGAVAESRPRIEYGWINLNTSQRPSQVVTPGANARISARSEASISYDQSADVGRFAALRGSIEVDVPGGARRQVAELEQVVQAGQRLSEPRPLPAAPVLVAPADNEQLAIERDRTAVLGWQPVAGAARYALQISRNRLFSDNVIDVADRSVPRATVALRGEGIFLWRVAAASRDGALGPWSAVRQFRVVRGETAGDADRMPPSLVLEDVAVYGTLLIAAGRTEPGATVAINGEPTAVDAAGAFRKTVQLGREGWNVLEVRASDAWGNHATRSRRVFVESL